MKEKDYSVKYLKRCDLYHGEYRWINKIGLRNPGIDYGIKHYNFKTDIISIAIMEKKEINLFLNKIPEDVNLEINVSCPNTDKHMINDGIHVFLNQKENGVLLNYRQRLINL